MNTLDMTVRIMSLLVLSTRCHGFKFRSGCTSFFWYCTKKKHSLYQDTRNFYVKYPPEFENELCAFASVDKCRRGMKTVIITMIAEEDDCVNGRVAKSREHSPTFPCRIWMAVKLVVLILLSTVSLLMCDVTEHATYST